MLTKVVVVVAVGAYGWWAVARPPFSASAALAVVGAGLAAMLVGAVHRRTQPAAAAAPAALRVRDVAGWLALLAAMVLWQMQAYLQHPRDDHPTLSSLTDALLDTRPERAAAFLVWVLVARELVRR